MKRKEMIGRWAGLSRAKQKEKGLDLWDVTAPTYSRLQWPVLSFTKAEGVVISASGRKPTTAATFPSSIWNSSNSNGREWDGYASPVCVCVCVCQLAGPATYSHSQETVSRLDTHTYNNCSAAAAAAVMHGQPSFWLRAFCVLAWPGPFSLWWMIRCQDQ